MTVRHDFEDGGSLGDSRELQAVVLMLNAVINCCMLFRRSWKSFSYNFTTSKPEMFICIVGPSKTVG